MSSYALNPWAIPSLIALVVNGLAGLYVLKMNPKHVLHRTFAGIILAFVLWDFGELMMRSVVGTADMHVSTAYTWARFAWVGVVFTPAAALNFSFLIARRKTWFTKNKYNLLIFYVPSICFAVLVVFSELVISGAVLRYWGYTGEREHCPGYTSYVIYHMLLTLFALFVLWKGWRGAKSVIERLQLKYVFAGITIAVLAGSGSQILMPKLGYDFLPIAGITTIIMTGFFGYAVHKYRLFVVEPTIEEYKAPVETKYRLELGHSYLIKENTGVAGFEIFRGMVADVPGVCITPTHPSKVREKYRLEKTPMFWLTSTAIQTAEKTFNPERLDFEIMYTLVSFIRDNKKTIVFLDNFEYTIKINGFDQSMTFIKSLNDIASANSGIVVVSVNPEMLDKKSFSILGGMFDDVIDICHLSEEPNHDELMIRTRYAYLIQEEKPANSYDIFKQWLSKYSPLCITSTFPEKIKNKYVLGDTPIYWVTDTGGGENVIRPERLKFELAKLISDFTKENEKSMVIIDNILPLVLANGFDEVHSFFKDMIDLISERDACLVVSLDPASLETTEHLIFARRFDKVFRFAR